MLVIFLFLQSWRSTLIPTITIPVSLVGAFAFIKLMGFSINTLTLFGIILATGIVVDDAIVVIENIERHIQEYKMPAQQAASDAMREVLGAVIATALVLIAVFVPVAFFPGTTGRLYAQFSMTIAFAVALSAFNARDADAGAVRRCCSIAQHHGKGVFFTRRRARDHRRHQRVRRACCGGRCARAGLWCCVFVAALGLTVLGLSDRAAVRSCRKRTRATSSLIVQAPAGASLEYTGDDRAPGRADHPEGPGRRWRVLGHGLQLQRRRAEPGAHVRAA